MSVMSKTDTVSAHSDEYNYMLALLRLILDLLTGIAEMLGR